MWQKKGISVDLKFQQQACRDCLSLKRGADTISLAERAQLLNLASFLGVLLTGLILMGC